MLKQISNFSLGTFFLQRWKRKSATLAHKWYVDEFEVTEPDRPKFYGTQFRKVR